MLRFTAQGYSDGGSYLLRLRTGISSISRKLRQSLLEIEMNAFEQLQEKVKEQRETFGDITEIKLRLDRIIQVTEGKEQEAHRQFISMQEVVKRLEELYILESRRNIRFLTENVNIEDIASAAKKE
jgi:hypothetical protein